MKWINYYGYCVCGMNGYTVCSKHVLVGTDYTWLKAQSPSAL